MITPDWCLEKKENNFSSQQECLLDGDFGISLLRLRTVKVALMKTLTYRLGKGHESSDKAQIFLETKRPYVIYYDTLSTKNLVNEKHLFFELLIAIIFYPER